MPEVLRVIRVPGGGNGRRKKCGRGGRAMVARLAGNAMKLAAVLLLLAVERRFYGEENWFVRFFGERAVC